MQTSWNKIFFARRVCPQWSTTLPITLLYGIKQRGLYK